MNKYINADACPVTRIAECVAREHNIPVVLFCDTNHILSSSYSALGKGAKAIHQSGRWYTDENIDSLLMERHMAKVARRSAKHHLKGPAKRTDEDDRRFEESFRRLIEGCLESGA